MTLDLADVGAGDFEPHVGSTFDASGTGDGFSLVLAEVSRGPGGPAREQFTLTFVGGPNPPVPQGMRRLDHELLGSLDLFLVPIGPGADGQHRYEAVFA